MPNAVWNLVPGPGFEEALKVSAREQIATEMRRRLLVNRGAIMMKISAFLKATFWNTPVCKAMTGRDYSNDLAAEFGVTDHTMMVVAEKMAEIVGEVHFVGPGIDITPKHGTIMIADIRAVTTNWAAYEMGQKTAYQSQPSGRYIKWLEWMLEHPSIDFITAKFDIVFKGEAAIFDKRISTVSRSGRAIMATIKRLQKAGLPKGGYLLPDICRQKVGKNFLEYTFEQPDVAQHVLNIVKEYL